MMQKIISLFFILIIVSSFVNSEVLVTTIVDKENISTNEVALLTIKLENNSEQIDNYPIRIEVSDNLIILKNNQQNYVENIDSLKTKLQKEVTIRIKAKDTLKETGEIFVYYGAGFKFVSGTYVNTKPVPVLFNTSVIKKLTDDGEKIFVNFEMRNTSGNDLRGIAVQVNAPQNFVVQNDPVLIEILPDTNGIKKEFSILPPLGINGEKDIVLAYGYFDEEPHYFEETFTINFEKENNMLLAGIGIIILVIAIFLYVNKSNAPKQGIKGTAEKE